MSPKKSLKKLVAIVLAVLMVLTSLPMVVLAKTDEVVDAGFEGRLGCSDYYRKDIFYDDESMEYYAEPPEFDEEESIVLVFSDNDVAYYHYSPEEDAFTSEDGDRITLSYDHFWFDENVILFYYTINECNDMEICRGYDLMDKPDDGIEVYFSTERDFTIYQNGAPVFEDGDVLEIDYEWMGYREYYYYNTAYNQFMSEDECDSVNISLEYDSWELGKTTVTIYVDGIEEPVTFTATVIENPVDHAEFDGESFTLYENIDGWYYEDSGEFYYDAPEFHYGDCITLYFTDGTEKVYYYSYDGFEADDGELLEVSRTTVGYITWSDPTVTLTIEAYGVQINEPVEIIEFPVESIEFVPAGEHIVYQYTNGSWLEEDSDVWYYDASINFLAGDQIIINYKDGTTQIYECDENYGDFYNVEDEEDCLGSVYTDSIGVFEGLGDADVSFVVDKFNFEVWTTVKIVENPVDYIDYVPVEPIVICENTNGWWDDYYGEDDPFWYYLAPMIQFGDQLTIHFKDGIADTYTFVKEDDYGIFKNASGDTIDVWLNDIGEFYGTGDVTIYGSVGDYYADFEVPATIIENPVSSIEYKQNSPLVEGVDNEFRYNEYEVLSDAYFPGCVYGDTLTVSYKDGTSKTYTFVGNRKDYDIRFVDEDGEELPYINTFYVDREGLIDNTEYEVGKNVSYIEYLGVSCEFEFEILPMDIASVKLISNSPIVVSPCEDCEPAEYPCPNFDIEVTTKDGKTKTYTIDWEDNDGFPYAIKEYDDQLIYDELDNPYQTWGAGESHSFFIYITSNCFFELPVMTAPASHRHEYISSTVEPTCSSEGYTEYICTICGDSYNDDFVEPIAHTVVVDELVPASPSSSGLTEGSHCSVCGQVITEQEYIFRPESIHLSNVGFFYNGKVQKPTAVIKDANDYTLVDGKDYYLTYGDDNSLDAGTYTVTINFIGNYTGTSTQNYTIHPTSPGLILYFDAISFDYDGNVHKPVFEPTGVNNTKLVEGKDFTVEFENPNSTEVGTYRAKIIYQGNYYGDTTINYTIEPCKHKDTPTKLVGEVKATSTADGYTGDVICTVCGDVITKGQTIPRAKTYTFSGNVFVYNGSVQRPTVTIKDSQGKDLVYKEDFTVRYDNWSSTDAGTYKMYVDLMGKYEGAKTFEYTITPKTGGLIIGFDSLSFVYNEAVQKPNFTITDWSGAKLVEGKDYVVNYENPNSTELGKYNVTIEYQGNYAGTSNMTYSIINCDHVGKPTSVINVQKATADKDGYTGDTICSECKEVIKAGTVIPKASNIVLSQTEFDYTGKVQRPLVTVFDEKGNQLTYKTDFTVNYSNWSSTNAGEYTVTVSLVGDKYADSVDYTYTINPLTNVTPKLNRTTIAYAGSPQRPSVTVTDAKGNALVYKQDFTVTYSDWNSSNVGRYTVTVNFMGNYSGSITYPYYINPKPTSFLTSAQGGFKGVKNGFTLKWNKQTSDDQITGYQIQYSTRSDFSGAATYTVANPSATSATITGRAANTRYYVRIRAYTKIGNGTFYSDWSTGTKSVVTLK